MIKQVNSILLATNLQEYNIVAFDMAMSLATRYDAKLITLHVIETLPKYAEKKMQWIMSEEQRDQIREQEKSEAHQKLIGKNISSVVIKNAIADYYKSQGKEIPASNLAEREVIVSEGDVVKTILKTAKEKNCGMIVMGAHEGLFDKNQVSKIIRSLLKKSSVPVLTVPCSVKK